MRSHCESLNPQSPTLSETYQNCSGLGPGTSASLRQYSHGGPLGRHVLWHWGHGFPARSPFDSFRAACFLSPETSAWRTSSGDSRLAGPE